MNQKRFFYLCKPLCSFIFFCLFTTDVYAACTSPAGVAGEVRYNGTLKVYQYCDDTNWTNMHKTGSGSGGCTSPTAIEGTLIYSSTQNAPLVCAGNIWQAMGVGNTADWQTLESSTGAYCGLKQDNSAWCWGWNTYGRLGDGTTTNTDYPVKVSGNYQWKKISPGGWVSCGVQDDDSAWCWGRNSHGSIGDGTTTDSLVPVEVSGGDTWKDIQAVYRGGCGIKSDDTGWCWGSRSWGLLGDGSTSGFSNVPVAINGGGTWKSMSAGWTHMCGIKGDDTAWCWGRNSNGRTGNGVSSATYSTPVAVSGGHTWKKISAGYVNTCGIRSDDTAWCWGRRTYGVVGDGGATTGDQTTPVQVSGSGSWVDIEAGGVINCGLKSDNSAWCWGNGTSGPLGNGTVAHQNVPVEVSGSISWDELSIPKYPVYLNYVDSERGDVVCGISNSNQLICWGNAEDYNSGLFPQTTQKAPQYITSPIDIDNTNTWKHIAVGGMVTCGIKDDDTGWCWGHRRGGAYIGSVNSLSLVPIPTAIDGGGTWKSMASSENSQGQTSSSCGIRNDETAWCWGNNQYGELGDGTTTTSQVPVQVTGGDTWKKIDISEHQACGIKSDNSAWCWGYRDRGAIGDGGATTGNQLTPVEVSGSGEWKDIGTGYKYACGLKTDNTAWCWGSNSNGNLGDGTTTNSNVPVQVSGGGAWIKIDVGNYGVCGIKTDYSMWCWGEGSSGLLGNNTTSDSSVPVEVAGGYSWSDVSHGGWSHACGVQAGGSLWCWGDNGQGQLGDGTLVDKLVPVQVDSTTNQWKNVETGHNDYYGIYHSCAMDINGKLACWGGFSANFGTTEIGYITEPKEISCFNPSGDPGHIIYDSTQDTMLYCGDKDWIRIGK